MFPPVSFAPAAYPACGKRMVLLQQIVIHDIMFMTLEGNRVDIPNQQNQFQPPKQMQADIPATLKEFEKATAVVSDFFTRTKIPTPFTALSVTPEIRDNVVTQIPPMFTRLDGRRIPLCRYGVNPEPFAAFNSSKIWATTSVCDQKRGLQIVLVEVNGRTHRKDGIPYHMIWSYDGRKQSFKRFTTDSIERRQAVETQSISHYKDGEPVYCGDIAYEDMTYSRTLSQIEKSAELLAVQSYSLANDMEATGSNLQIWPLRVHLKTMSDLPGENTCFDSCDSYPYLVRIACNSSGHQFGHMLA